MTADGPILDAIISVSMPRYQALQNAGSPIPQPIQLRMLLDTGASGCCINTGMLAPLGLTPSGTIQVHTPTTGNTPVQCNQFDVSLVIAHPVNPFFMPIMPITECRPLMGNIQGLIGRDVLSRCMLVYYGQMQGFSLAF
jgi:hypothetical protein